jgi:hypothetical protein
LLAHDRWFSSGIQASSTTKTGRHDIAEIYNYFAEYRMLFSRRHGNERDIFDIALDGTSLFRGSCIDVIKSRLRKNLKVPASSRKRNIENVALVTVTSRKQHAVFGKVIICPCYCIVFP